MSIRVLLVDDHLLLREGLKALLAREADIEVIAEAADGEQAVEMARALSPDVVAMDLGMPGIGGIEAIRRIVEEGLPVRILALTMFAERVAVQEALKAGAAGYMLKNCAAAECVEAIRTVAADLPYLSPLITSLILREYAGEAGDRPSAPRHLAPRETEVLCLIAEGKSTKEIAFDLGVSVKTIETQRSRIMKKLNLFSVAELTKFAIREGLTPLEDPG